VIEYLFGLALGIGLSAACGFRIFVPLLVMSAAARGGFLALAPGFEWLGSNEMLVTFAVATVLEIIAYYIPWVDNLLDTLTTPASVIAGTVVTASVIADVDPWLRWTLALIAGGGAAGLVQASTVALRGLSSMATGGLGNFLVSTAELFGAIITSVMAVLFPVVAVVFVVILLAAMAGRLSRRNRITRTATPAP
jgi:hypothetical protein